MAAGGCASLPGVLALRGGEDGNGERGEGFELLFLGTGVSTGLPKMGCIVRTPEDGGKPCEVRRNRTFCENDSVHLLRPCGRNEET